MNRDALPVAQTELSALGDASRASEPSLAVAVYGRPRPGGSKSAFPIKDKDTGKVKRIAVSESGKHTKEWRGTVAQVVADAMRIDGIDAPLMLGPLALELDFYLARPSGHYGTGRNAGQIKHSSPRFPTVKPDALKLARAIEDALTGITWRDDSQIVVERLRKFYGEPERVEIRLWADTAFVAYIAS